MAINTTASVIATSRTPESAVLDIANPGVVDTATYPFPRATLLAQLLDGPLKEGLRRTLDWSVFNTITGTAFFNRHIRLTAIAGGLNSIVAPPNLGLVLQFLPDALECSIYREDENVGAASLMLIELRAVHSNER